MQIQTRSADEPMTIFYKVRIKAKQKTKTKKTKTK